MTIHPRGEQILHELYTHENLERIAKIVRSNVSQWDAAGSIVRRRHEIIRATGPEPWEAGWAFKQAWSEYLAAAEECGLLADAELRGNLVSDADDNFRGAISECLAAWFLMRRIGATVRAKPETKSQKNADFSATLGQLIFYCEVKAPHEPIANRVYSGDDSKLLRSCIGLAGSQLKKGRCNLVLLAPTIRTDIYLDRNQLIKAIIGEHALNAYVSLDENPAPPPNVSFLQNGKLARQHLKTDGSVYTDFTRISAVASVEPVLNETERDELALEHKIVVVHNPFAETPMPVEVFAPFPQFAWCDENQMGWTDNWSKGGAASRPSPEG